MQASSLEMQMAVIHASTAMHDPEEHFVPAEHVGYDAHSSTVNGCPSDSFPLRPLAVAAAQAPAATDRNKTLGQGRNDGIERS
jgi:hypothetical protein